MEEQIKLNEILKFVNEKAKDQNSQYFQSEEIQETKKNIRDFTGRAQKDFTYTVGEMNAYMG